MVNKIVIKVEYWEDNKILSQSASSFDPTYLKFDEMCKFAAHKFKNTMSNVFTEYLTQ